jgi:hypothetical protein
VDTVPVTNYFAGKKKTPEQELLKGVLIEGSAAMRS